MPSLHQFKYELLIKEIRRRINDDMTVLATKHALGSILATIGETIDDGHVQPRRTAQAARGEAEEAMGASQYPRDDKSRP